MKVAILIGFGYTEQESKMRIPGILIDLHRSYEFAKRMEALKVLVFTDYQRNQKSYPIKEQLRNGELDAETLFFITNLKFQEQYHNYNSLESFKDQIERVTLGVSRLFIYYSGHAERGLIVLPKANREIDRISLPQLLSICVNKAHPQAEVFSIVDCCQSDGMGMSFKMIPGDEWYQYQKVYDLYKQGREIICLSSGNEEEFSETRIGGSQFTALLYELLNKKLYWPIGQLLKELKEGGYENTPVVTSSDPHLMELWRWTLSSTRLSISFDYLDQTILVKK